MLVKKLIVDSTDAGQRLDIFLSVRFPEYSRSALQRAIKSGHVTVNGHPTKPRYAVQENDTVVSTLAGAPEPGKDPVPNNLALPVLYEDKDIVVINKPAGILVHPTTTSREPTVADWFAAHYPQGSGYVHRLDKDTSGVLVLAKNQEAYQHLREQFKKHRVKKEYLALVFGVPGGADGRITRPIARSRRNPSRRTVLRQGFGRQAATGNVKEAITEWQLEKSLGTAFSLLRVMPLTGRTHQIRVHLHHIGHPVVGDALYVFKRQKPPPGVTRQLLHAEKLTVLLPSGKRQTFTAPVPDDFQSVLNRS